MIDPGTYRGRPVDARLGWTGTGKEQIAVLFEFLDPLGERLTWYGFFTPDTTDRTIESLRHCGWQGSDLSDFTGEALPEGFDREVDLVVKHETYNGKTSARIAFVNSGGGLAMKEAMSKEQVSSFAARMKRQIEAYDKAARRNAGASAQRQSAGRPANGGSGRVPQDVIDAQEGSHPPKDDLPF